MIIMALVKRIITQVIRDKRTLALMMIAPLVILSLVNFLFTSNNNVKVKIGTYKISDNLNKNLTESDIDIVKYNNTLNVENKIKNDKLKAFINEDNGKLAVTYENSNPTDTQKIKAKIQGALVKAQVNGLKQIVQKVNPNVFKENSNMDIKSSYVYGDENLEYFDTLSPILIGFFVFFFVFLISGISLLKERTSKTLEKLLSTPIKRSEIILGYLFGYGIFAVIQTIVVVLFSIYVLNIRIEGNISLVILTNIIISFVALSLGILLSTFANSEFQMMQFIPIVVVPQIFFTGLIPVDTMANWLQKVAHVMPLYYGAQAIQGIMIKSFNFNDISFYLGVLFLFIVVFYILNVLGLKRYRKI